MILTHKNWKICTISQSSKKPRMAKSFGVSLKIKESPFLTLKARLWSIFVNFSKKMVIGFQLKRVFH